MKKTINVRVPQYYTLTRDKPTTVHIAQMLKGLIPDARPQQVRDYVKALKGEWYEFTPKGVTRE